MSTDEVFHLSAAQSQELVAGGDTPLARLQLVLPARDLDARVLTERWSAAAARHDPLRLAFVRKPGLASLLQGLDVHAPPLVATDRDTHEVADAEWAVHLDPGRGGLVRVALTSSDLVLTAAAVVADGRSLALLADELLTGSPASEEPLSFLDFASWEREQLEEDSADTRVGRAYWRGVGVSSDRPSARYAGTVRAQPLPDVSGADADTWLTALALATRPALDDPEDRPVLAVAVSGRTDEELETALGPYQRYVPVVTPVLDDLTLAGLRERLVADTEAAARFASFAPDPGPAPAFQHLPVGLRATLGRHPVELVVVAGRATLHHDPDRLDEHRAGWLAARITRCARACMVDGDSAATGLDPLDDDERSFLLRNLSGEGVAPAHADLVAAVASHAATRPDAVAVVHGDEHLTYAALVARARGVAGTVGDGTRPVGVLFERSIDAVAVALGVMWSGRPYAALDPAHPSARLADQLTAAGIDTVVTTEDLAGRVPMARCVLRSDLHAAPSAQESSPVDADDPAYLIFTSGSTGTPKPVVVTHRNLASYAAGVGVRLGLDEHSRMAAVTGLSTDLGHTSVFGALFHGGTVEVVPEDCLTSGTRLAALVDDHGVTGLKITPSHLRALLAAGDVRLDLPLLVCGGEPLDVALVAQARAAGVQRVVNHYGPTETTVGVLSHEVRPDADDPVPLGRPLPHVRLRVVDRTGRWVPVGQVGELEVSGSSVSAGYVGTDAPAFGTDEDGTRRYRTGDLVRVADDGAVVFVGRVDGQVKVRGHRVDLGDVESHLRGETGVTDAAAVVVDDAVRAFVVGAGDRLDTTDVLRRLAGRLPAHMVPVSLHRLPELPRTPSGKIDRRALATRDHAVAPEVEAGVAPSTETERVLLDIWREVVPGSVAGVDDNFFRVGGHSLMATKVIARSRATFAVDLPLHVIFAAPTVAGMAAEIDARLGAAADDVAVDDLLRELAGVSDEDVARLLEADGSARAEDD